MDEHADPPTKRIQVIREPCKTISNNHRTHKHRHTRRNPTKRIQVTTEHTEHRRTRRNHTKRIQAITLHSRTHRNPTKRTEVSQNTQNIDAHAKTLQNEVITEHTKYGRARRNPTRRIQFVHSFPMV